MAFEPTLNMMIKAAQHLLTVFSPLKKSFHLHQSHLPQPHKLPPLPAERTYTEILETGMSTLAFISAGISDIDKPTSTFKLVNFPSCHPGYVLQDTIMHQNETLWVHWMEAKNQMEANHTSKMLMDAENQQFQNKLFNKTTKPTQRNEGDFSACHTTS